MSDIRDWGAFIRGRWNWTRYGYEHGFPRGCQFSDIDAVVEFNDRVLFIETKHYEGVGNLTRPARGQTLLAERLTRDPSTSYLLVYGCGCCNNPQAAWDAATGILHDWRTLELVERRRRLKAVIDAAMDLHPLVEGVA